MSLVLAGIVVLIMYLHWSGKLTTRTLERSIAAGIGLLALRLGFGGSPVVGIALGATATMLALRAGRHGTPARGEADARALLGVGPQAGPDDIRAAHRRLAADAHPDLGGNTAAMQALNAARDLLLRRSNPG